jgi:type I restriction enzyme S subunit
MNTAQLVANFVRLSDSPEAAPRLRRFILDLAVRGKIIEQDPDDEPADELIKRVRIERKRLISLGAIKNEPIPVEPVDAQKPYPIPNNWQWIRLGDALGMINGRAFKPTDWLPAGLPIVRIQNLNNENALFNYCDESKVESRHLIESDAFLIRLVWNAGHIVRCIYLEAG